MHHSTRPRGDFIFGSEAALCNVILTAVRAFEYACMLTGKRYKPRDSSRGSDTIGFRLRHSQSNTS
jgi:hypothetical protein